MSDYAVLRTTAAEWEAEFARQKAHYGSKIQCRLGCTDCCHHLFRITELEGAYISNGIKGLARDALKCCASAELSAKKGSRKGTAAAWRR